MSEFHTPAVRCALRDAKLIEVTRTRSLSMLSKHHNPVAAADQNDYSPARRGPGKVQVLRAGPERYVEGKFCRMPGSARAQASAVAISFVAPAQSEAL